MGVYIDSIATITVLTLTLGTAADCARPEEIVPYIGGAHAAVDEDLKRELRCPPFLVSNWGHEHSSQLWNGLDSATVGRRRTTASIPVFPPRARGRRWRKHLLQSIDRVSSSVRSRLWRDRPFLESGLESQSVSNGLTALEDRRGCEQASGCRPWAGSIDWDSLINLIVRYQITSYRRRDRPPVFRLSDDLSALKRFQDRTSPLHLYPPIDL